MVMSRNTSIALLEHHEAFIARLVASGKHASASEAMREALRRYEEQEQKRAELDTLLAAGMASPIAPTGAIDQLIAELDKRYGG
jgi:antitoxin ParD1/3/4